MGTGEEAAASKPSKPPASTQELPTPPAYPDWSSPVQAYYGAGATPPFFASTVPSPTPHPYLWGSHQHHLVPPYGTPVPYPHMYPHGGVYAHPNMTVAPGSAQTPSDLEKGSNGKEGASSKKNEGVSGNGSSVGSKGGDGVKATSGSGNDGGSHRGDSGSEGSSDANEDNQQEFGTRKPVAGTNLNMGMGLWNASSSGGSKARQPGEMVSDQWTHDERELKRQRRKQSNRESARRSRLRKQAECEELQVRVESLSSENSCLKEELQRLSEECEKLTSENTSIKEELTRICGTDAVAALEHKGSAVAQSRGDEEDDS